MSQILLEIFSEDCPANLQIEGLKRLEAIFIKHLSLGQNQINGLISPRHFLLHINHYQLNKFLSVKGPRVTAPKDAIQGFINKYQIKSHDLVERNGILYIEKNLDQNEAKESIIKTIETCLNDMVWPRSMTWGKGESYWIRPIHSIMCFLDDRILPIKFCNKVAKDITKGHRNLNSPTIKITSADLNDYTKALLNGGVMVDYKSREISILEQISTLLSSDQKMISDQKLLQELVGLVENPHVFLGEIDKDFLKLPKEILITALKNHQKYLMVEDNSGNLLPHFIIVADILPRDGGKILQEGHEKVLKARLKDAQFFFNNDIKNGFINLIEKLKIKQFHKELGTLEDKVIRIKNWVNKITQALNIDNKIPVRAAELCKLDLLTQMVGEFPELQAIIGYYYSKEEGEAEEVAMAIRDHYKPLGPNDSLPATIEGAILALSDKFDNLESFFAANIKPTSTKDPYGLRRAALGALRIIDHYQFNRKVLESILSSEIVNFLKNKEG